MQAFNAVRAAAIVLSLYLTAGAGLAETTGGLVRATLTIDDKPMAVRITWYQSGGVVILKIVSNDPVPQAERGPVLDAAESLVFGRTGGRAAFATTGQLMMGLQLAGWTRKFTAEDLELSEEPPQVVEVQP